MNHAQKDDDNVYGMEEPVQANKSEMEVTSDAAKNDKDTCHKDIKLDKHSDENLSSDE